MKKFLKVLGAIFSVLLVTAIVFGFGYFFGNRSNGGKAEVVPASSSGIDLKLPGEVEKSIITVDEVDAKIIEIGELETCEGDYTVTRGKDFTRYFVDKIPIPGSTNHVELTCTGIVKAGYSLEDIAVRVDNESMKIYVALPQAKIMSNQLIWDSVVCNEQNSMLNPIDFEQYQTLISEIESEGLEEVQKKGFFDTVESNAKKLIGNFLGCFADYTVEFI